MSSWEVRGANLLEGETSNAYTYGSRVRIQHLYMKDSNAYMHLFLILQYICYVCVSSYYCTLARNI
jgi:hypothetical protein